VNVAFSMCCHLLLPLIDSWTDTLVFMCLHQSHVCCLYCQNAEWQSRNLTRQWVACYCTPHSQQHRLQILALTVETTLNLHACLVRLTFVPC
jgi:hypothetical protein